MESQPTDVDPASQYTEDGNKPNNIGEGMWASLRQPFLLSLSSL